MGSAGPNISSLTVKQNSCERSENVSISHNNRVVVVTVTSKYSQDLSFNERFCLFMSIMLLRSHNKEPWPAAPEDAHVDGCIGDDCGIVKIAIIERGAFTKGRPCATNEHLGTLGNCVLHSAVNGLHRVCSDHWTDGRSWIQAAANLPHVCVYVCCRGRDRHHVCNDRRDDLKYNQGNSQSI